MSFVERVMRLAVEKRSISCMEKEPTLSKSFCLTVWQSPALMCAEKKPAKPDKMIEPKQSASMIAPVIKISFTPAPAPTCEMISAIYSGSAMSIATVPTTRQITAKN